MNRMSRDACGGLHLAAPSAVDFHPRSPIGARRHGPDPRGGGSRLLPATSQGSTKAEGRGSSKAEAVSLAAYLSCRSFLTAVTPCTERAISTALARLAALSTKPLNCTTPL